MSKDPNFTQKDIDTTCRAALSTFFNAAASLRAQFTSVPAYLVDWDNLDNDGFVNKAKFYGLRVVVSGSVPVNAQGLTPGHLDLKVNDDKLECVSMTYASEHSNRLKAVLEYAEKWRKENGVHQYSEPRLIEMPSVKMSALWLAGPKNVFIPVAEFSTKLSDPIAVDKDYLDKVRQHVAAQRKAYKDLDGLSPPGG